ncbi:MAG: hypothetical protein V4509_01950 [Patescibacteria group bacterium]
MHLYFDQDNLPQRAQIACYSTSKTPLFDEIDEWIDYVKSEGEVLLEVICEDGIVMIVRTYEGRK